MFVSCSNNLIYAAMLEPGDSGHSRYQTNTLLLGLDKLTCNYSAPEPDDHRAGRGRRSGAEQLPVSLSRPNKRVFV